MDDIRMMSDGEGGEYAREVWGWAQRIISKSGCIYGAWNASAKLFEAVFLHICRLLFLFFLPNTTLLLFSFLSHINVFLLFSTSNFKNH